MINPTRIQAASGVNTTFVSTVSATFSSPNTKGNTIILAWEGDAALGAANTPTDTAGNKYMRAFTITVTATFILDIWVAYNCKTQASNIVTVTDAGGGVDSIVVVEEWSGISTVQVLDGIPVGASDVTSTSSALASGNISPTGSQDVLWCAGVISGAVTLTAGAGFSNKTQNNTTFSTLGIASQVLSSAQTIQGTFSSSLVGSWACAVIALRAAHINTLKRTSRPRPFAPGRAK